MVSRVRVCAGGGGAAADRFTAPMPHLAETLKVEENIPRQWWCGDVEVCGVQRTNDGCVEIRIQIVAVIRIIVCGRCSLRCTKRCVGLVLWSECRTCNVCKSCRFLLLFVCACGIVCRGGTVAVRTGELHHTGNTLRALPDSSSFVSILPIVCSVKL